MDPESAIRRGVKISASNPELAVVFWAVGVGAALLIVVPVAALAVAGAVALAADAPTGATGTEALLAAAESLVAYWPWVFGASLVAILWTGLILFAYLYAQAGLVGCVVRSQRSGPASDRALRPKLGASQAFKAFSFGLLWEEAQTHGWRVTMVATAYSMAGTLPLVLYGAWLLGCVRLALRGSVPSIVAGAAGAMVGLVPLALIVFALAIHYRFALVCCVQRACGWREAVSAANGVFKSRPLPALAVVGAAMAARYLVGMAFFLLSLPLLLLSLVPLVGLVMLAPRVLLGLAQSLIGSAIGIAQLGAIAALCEPVCEDGIGNPEKSRGGAPPPPGAVPAPTGDSLPT